MSAFPKRTLHTLILVTGICFLAACPQRPKSRPHVVLLVVDTLRADKLGCYGFAADTSPRIDELAAAGARFDQVIAPSSWTRPSMGSLLSGLYPRTLGLYREEGDCFPAPFNSLAEYLKEVGYQTFGMTSNPNINSAFGFDQGFDLYHDSDVVLEWMVPESEWGDRAYDRLASAPEIFDAALSWIDQRDQTDPLFLQLLLMEVHEHDRARLSLTRREYRSMFRELEDPFYLQTVRQVTDDIGQFVADLSRRAGWSDALFIIVSDHGEGLNDHPGVTHSRWHGYQVFESQVRVPWIIYKADGSLAGKVVHDAVSLVDVAPTILDLLAIEPLQMDGISATDLLGLTASRPHRSFEVAETYFRDCDKTALFTPEWKFFVNRDQWPGLETNELYERGVHELGARNQVAADQPELVLGMQKQITDWDARYPKRPAISGTAELSETELEQLRAIGYVQ